MPLRYLQTLSNALVADRACINTMMSYIVLNLCLLDGSEISEQRKERNKNGIILPEVGQLEVMFFFQMTLAHYYGSAH